MTSYRRWRVTDTLTFGAWRRRRKLRHLLRDIDTPVPARPRRLTPDPHPGQAEKRHRQEPGGPQTRKDQTKSIVAIIAVFLVATVGIPYLRQHLTHTSLPAGWPPVAADQTDHRLLPAVAGPAGHGGYTFMRLLPDGHPVRYDPCQPIHYVIDPVEAPSGGTALVRAAVARVSAATGLAFVYDGTSTEVARPNRPPVQKSRYGNRWAPVLVSWATAAQNPVLAGPVAGRGGSEATGRNPSDVHYVTGAVLLDRDQVTWTRQNPAARAVARGIVLHELGHLVGLAHVHDRHQLMYSEAVRGVTDYAAGDLRGLAVLGDGACTPDE